MPFVLINNVRINNVDQARQGLQNQLIPDIKKAPGFVRGTWSADQNSGRGVGVILFQSRETAEAMLRRLQNEEELQQEGVTLDSAAIYEVQAEA